MDATTIEALQTAVIARLQAKIPEAQVDLFPDEPDNYSFVAPVWALLVRYHGSVYGHPQAADIIVHARRLSVEVITIARQLNGAEGVTALLERVGLALRGFQPPGFTKLAQARDEFLEQGGGQWRYAADFTTSTLAMEDAADADGPLATRIIFEDTNGVERVRVPRPG